MHAGSLHCSSDGAERTDDGRAFHARAAVTGKARSPSVVRLVDGMTSVDVEALRRRRREPTLAVKCRISAMYDGAVPIRQRYARTHNRNWILSGTFSQCSSRRSCYVGLLVNSASDFLAGCRRLKLQGCSSSLFRRQDELLVLVAERLEGGPVNSRVCAFPEFSACMAEVVSKGA